MVSVRLNKNDWDHVHGRLVENNHTITEVVRWFLDAYADGTLKISETITIETPHGAVTVPKCLSRG